MEYIVNNSQVYTKRVTDGGTVIVTYHDAEYHFRLTSDGGTVTAQIYDYLGEQQDTDGVEVTFDIDGKQQVLRRRAGPCPLQFHLMQK